MIDKIMYQFQNDLPKIPLPKLEETCDCYLKTVAPFLQETELQKTQAAVTAFQQGIGRQLQKQLEMLVSYQPRYLYQLLEESYLKNREPLTINTNPGVVCFPLSTSDQLPFVRITAI